MTNLNQLIIKFDYEQNFKDDDFYVSECNKHIFNLLNQWPRWEKNFLNINGEKFSGSAKLVDDDDLARKISSLKYTNKARQEESRIILEVSLSIE